MQMMPMDPGAAPEGGSVGMEQESALERQSYRVPRAAAAAPDQTLGNIYASEPAIKSRDVSVYYGDKRALYDVSLDIGKNEVIALIGPSGCGKSTYLRCLNRMNDTIDGCRVTGRIELDEEDVYSP